MASTDYMSAVPDQIRQFVPNTFATLGADSYGFSDTRAAARRFFHIDVHSIVVRALQELAAKGEVSSSAPKEAAEKYQLLDVNAGTTGNAGGSRKAGGQVGTTRIHLRNLARRLRRAEPAHSSRSILSALDGRDIDVGRRPPPCRLPRTDMSVALSTLSAW